MSLVKWNGDTFPELLTDFFDNDRFLGTNALDKLISTSIPAANIVENHKEYAIELAAPGLEKKDFKIEIDNGILSVSAEKKSEKKEEKENYSRKEFSYSSFNRSFRLPESVKSEDIKAQYDNGILHLSVPKKEDAKKAQKKAITVA